MMENRSFVKRIGAVLQILFLLFDSSSSSFSQEKFMLTQKDLPDYELLYQSINPEMIYQDWKANIGNYVLYIRYYEYEDEFNAINGISYQSGSFASPYYFGFPNGEIKANSSWTSTDRRAAFIQKWNVGVQVFCPITAGNIISSISDKLLYRIRDSISTKFLAKDSELKKHQVSLPDYTRITRAATDTLANNGFSENKVEDSKWIFNSDSLMMGIRKQWSGEMSFFSIDVAEFSNNTDAQKAAEQNANIKRSPFFLPDDEESLEKAISDWNYHWSVYDTMKYISVVGRTGNEVVHFYYFAEKGVDIGLFRRVLQAINKTGTGISKNKAEAIEIYPNPANDFIIITSPANDTRKYSLAIKDICERTITRETIELTGSYLLNISGLTQGIYFIILQNENKRITKKIMVL